MPRPSQSRRARKAEASAGPPVPIPDKLYFRIREVSALTRTKAYVLRYWETEFPTLRPAKTRTGHRLYRREDVETIFEIKRLLYEEGFTIEGARKHLAGNSSGAEAAPSPVHSSQIGQQLRAIRRELEGILTILSRKC